MSSFWHHPLPLTIEIISATTEENEAVRGRGRSGLSRSHMTFPSLQRSLAGSSLGSRRLEDIALFEREVLAEAFQQISSADPLNEVLLRIAVPCVRQMLLSQFLSSIEASRQTPA
ncbi:hypothetical protein SAMN05421819_0009 [Bryocella elongata]|uniref:Uncharacterized protein n=1 Tax=Bryocella elongata TaxID=863522 RepID=A0A1H5S145_9BACT|nr:hypothetical protein SAMN05421819_0009 [Bryocella elongata]